MVTDLKQKNELVESLKACSGLKIDFDFGRHNNRYFHDADLIVVSPGVPLNIKPLEEAREKNVKITSEVDIAASALKLPLIAVTGTNGKTTTTALIGEMFDSDKRSPYVGGNIGYPLLDYFNNSCSAEIAIVELSSFQLDSISNLVPAVAVFTNIDQDHMDRYPDMSNYVESKKRLLRACDRNSFVVLNYDDPNVRSFANETTAKVIWFTRRDPMTISGEFSENFLGAYYVTADNSIKMKMGHKEEVYDLKKFRLFGTHNQENLMAAICAARAMDVKKEAIQLVIDGFHGVPHRLEFVRKKDGVFFFNDSKATNVMSVYRSLAAFRRNPVILIAGGKDKDMDFNPLSDVVRSRCKILILLGEAKEKLNRAIGDDAETYLVGTFEEAVLLAYQKSCSGDIILLSPGCASFDMFRNFEERGDYFRKLVQQL